MKKTFFLSLFLTAFLLFSCSAPANLYMKKGTAEFNSTTTLIAGKWRINSIVYYGQSFIPVYSSGNIAFNPDSLFYTINLNLSGEAISKRMGEKIGFVVDKYALTYKNNWDVIANGKLLLLPISPLNLSLSIKGSGNINEFIDEESKLKSNLNLLFNRDNITKYDSVRVYENSITSIMPIVEDTVSFSFSEKKDILYLTGKNLKIELHK